MARIRFYSDFGPYAVVSLSRTNANQHTKGQDAEPEAEVCSGPDMLKAYAKVTSW